jgi:hypothetical protein
LKCKKEYKLESKKEYKSKCKKEYKLESKKEYKSVGLHSPASLCYGFQDSGDFWKPAEFAGKPTITRGDRTSVTSGLIL